jgi:DNA-nicking Smr family endonuclease
VTRRRLAPDEVELWKKVAERTERLHPRKSVDFDAYVQPAKHRTGPGLDLAMLDGKPHVRPVARKVSYDLVPALPDRLRKAAVEMDKKTFARMSRGKLQPEARIDLHGMTLDRAHAALTRFVLLAHGSGKRLVLVITGKGKNRDEGGPIPVRYGVLRHQVPQWLRMQPLASSVLQISEAHVSHGGAGAYYVYLRRQR